MTGLQVGRIGLNDVTLYAPHSGTESATEWSISGQFAADTAAQYFTLAQQIRGYPCADEPIVPVILSGDIIDTYRNGFYEVVSASVSRSVGGGEFGRIGDFEFTFRRPTGKSAPAIEALYAGQLLSNSVSITSTNERYMWAVPATAFDRNGPAGGTWRTRSTSTGDLAFWYNKTAAFTSNLYWADAPENFYTGAACIEARTGGDTSWHTVVGNDVENLPDAVRIHNGIVRVTFQGSTSFIVEWWNGESWGESFQRYIVTGDTFGQLNDCTSVSVIRNSPEEVRVHATYGAALVSTSGRIAIDFKLRRGARMVTAVLKSDVPQAWSVQPNGGGAYNSVTGGVVRSANDSYGNRDILLSPSTVTKTLAGVNGGKIILSSSAATFVFGIGLELGGTGADYPDIWNSERDGFFAVVGEWHRVRGR